MFYPLKTLPALLMLISPLGACQSSSQTASAGISDFCLIAKPFRWSKNDTPETIVQAKTINAQGMRLCGWKPS